MCSHVEPPLAWHDAEANHCVALVPVEGNDTSGKGLIRTDDRF
jgi:hypothetical protein